MPGLVPGIHVFALVGTHKHVDGRDIGVRKHAVLRTAMPGHDKLTVADAISQAASIPPATFCQSVNQSRGKRKVISALSTRRSSRQTPELVTPLREQRARKCSGAFDSKRDRRPRKAYRCESRET